MYTGLVSRQQALDLIKEHSYLVSYDGNSIEYGMTLTGIEQALNELPSVQPKEKTGKWIKDEDGKVTCNNCYEYSIVTDNIVGATDLLEVITLTMKYCPNCGAKMEV